MKIMTVLSLLAIHTSLAATSIYTWQDEHGITHFSDMPRQGAETVALAPPATVTLSEPDEAHAPRQQQPPALPPLSLALVSPTDQQTLRDNSGTVILSLSTNRPLAEHEQILVLLDGAPYAAPEASLHWQLHNIDRGSHRLQVQAVKDGKVIASSQAITVFLHRASMLQRTPPGPEPK
ncbi:DUF4124 domain-containing protein [Photobacterium atrarenae]|uniref:DUF4124 domain-containing protein n=1 Tax=Photobacterium atrarenae TaxID=865757 RepID=A0ABY5GEP1_9GAMM|nr:DUF4124 domain-containing protein [Photobacterium atrarenae]UTV27647.1 DUF4124 domain-containing protein [Photobacterium atrarenae]